MSANTFCPLLGEAHGPHDFDYSEDGAHYAGHCDGDESPYAGGPTDVTALLSQPLRSMPEAVVWIHAMYRQGYGTHPDDSGEDIVDPGGDPLFTPDEAALFDARWAEVFALVPDPYTVALSALNRNRWQA